jgi:hypothetical protein
MNIHPENSNWASLSTANPSILPRDAEANRRPGSMQSLNTRGAVELPALVTLPACRTALDHGGST